MSAALRIGKEMKEYEKKEYSKMKVNLDEKSALRQIITVSLDDDFGYSIDLEVVHPEDYPFNPPKVSLIACSNRSFFFYKLQKVCPDIVCWRPQDLFEEGGVRLGPRIFKASEWSPALTVPASLLNFVNMFQNRLRGLSLEESYPFISESITDLKPFGVAGSAKIVFGANLEGDPTSDKIGPQFVLLMDPLYDTGEFDQSNLTRYKSNETTYVKLAAPFCFRDRGSFKTMERLLAQLCEKGYTDVQAYQSGISLRMPNNIPILPYYPLATGMGTRVITPGDYGG